MQHRLTATRIFLLLALLGIVDLVLGLFAPSPAPAAWRVGALGIYVAVFVLGLLSDPRTWILQVRATVRARLLLVLLLGAMAALIAYGLKVRVHESVAPVGDPAPANRSVTPPAPEARTQASPPAPVDAGSDPMPLVAPGGGAPVIAPGPLGAEEGDDG